MRTTGVTARGIIAPIFKKGDDLVSAVRDCILNAAKVEGFEIHDKDVIGITESVVARTQGNYATVEAIAEDIKNKMQSDTLGIVFPILSRNRFAIILKAIAMSCEKLYIQLSYPTDEVGNQLISYIDCDSAGVYPEFDSFDEDGYISRFGEHKKHPFTGVDYIDYYKSLGSNVKILFSNDPRYILKYTKNVIACDIHTRQRTKARLLEGGADQVLGLDDIMVEPREGSGYNSTYGLLGSNKSSEDVIKLFPRDCDKFVYDLQKSMKDATGKTVEVLVYGDGCFKDSVGGIWELADPVVSPGFTSGLQGTPNEIKMKYFADDKYKDLRDDELAEAIKKEIKEKDSHLVGNMASQGTTPRQMTDLLGSLCDLTSGSGDRGTPIVLIQNYFTNYATE